MTAEAQEELRELDTQLEAAQLEIERLQYNRAVVLQQCDVCGMACVGRCDAEEEEQQRQQLCERKRNRS